MNSGVISNSSLSGGLDLQATLESGQTYLWDRDDGEDYLSSGLSGGGAWYSSVIEGSVIRLRQVEGQLEWKSTSDMDEVIRRVLGLDDDLDQIMKMGIEDSLVESAYTAYKGMRNVRAPVYRCVL